MREQDDKDARPPTVHAAAQELAAGARARPGSGERRGFKGRLLLLAPQPFFEGRGTPIAVRHVLEVASKLGVQVDLVTFPVGEPFELPGLRTFRVGGALPIRHVPVGLSTRKLVLDVLLVITALHLLRTESYDWIHAVEEAGFPAALARRFVGVPVLYDMQSSLPEQLAQLRWLGTSPVQRIARACERWLLRNVDQVVCSAGLKRHVRETPGAAPVEEWIFPGRRLDVPAAEVVRLRRELAIAEGAPVVVYTGTFAAYQGLDLLLAAGERVHATMPQAVFVLVGGHCRDATAVADRPWLRLLPRQPRDQVDRFLALADIAVSPRLGGGNLPLKLFDYMAAGKAIVATECASHRAVLDDDRARLVPADPDAFARAILDLLTRPEHASNLARAARAHADLHFARQAFADFLLRIYRYPLDGFAPAAGSRRRHATPLRASGTTRAGPMIRA